MNGPSLLRCVEFSAIILKLNLNLNVVGTKLLFSAAQHVSYEFQVKLYARTTSYEGIVTST